jgi:serine/threonine protein kinase
MPPPTFASGHLLVNRYRISELLGVGQTAEVYLAEDTSLQRSVVVKVLLPRLADTRTCDGPSVIGSCAPRR